MVQPVNYLRELGFGDPQQKYQQGAQLGQQIGQGLLGMEQRQHAQQQQQRQEQLRQQDLAFNQDLSKTLQGGGDLNELLAQNPQRFKQINQLQTYQKQLKQTGAQDIAGQVYLALDQDNPAQAAALLKSPEAQSMISGMGEQELSPEVINKMLQEDPDNLKDLALSTYRFAGGDLDRLGVKQEKPLTAYQAGQLEAQKEATAVKQDANDIKRLEREANKLKTKLSREKDEKSIEKIQQEIDIKNQEQKQKQKNVYNNSMDAQRTLSKNIDSLKSLITHDGFKSAVGWQGGIYSFPGSDARSFEGSLETVNSQAFISAIQNVAGMGLGALSDAEGKKLGTAIGALNTGMSEEKFEKEVNRIVGELEREHSVIRGRMPPDPDAGEEGTTTKSPAVGFVQDGYEFLGGDASKPESWRRL